MSMLIDYSDHWSHFDQRLTPYNFLRFGEHEWKRWNPSLMYQNRLRHADHMMLFDQAGFEIIEEETTGNNDDGYTALGTVPLSADFAGRDPNELVTTGARVALRRTP